VYCTMAWSTVTGHRASTVTSVRGKTVCRLIWESPNTYACEACAAVMEAGLVCVSKEFGERLAV
jgi:hypothetical protein